MTIRLKEEASAWNRVEAWFVFSYKLGPTYDVIVVVQYPLGLTLEIIKVSVLGGDFVL